MFRKVVITAAGKGTRLFPATKKQPKEMLTIFSETSSGDVSIKPMVQVVFEQLYGAGLREFCFVVGREKSIIKGHFTSDDNCFRMPQNIVKVADVVDLEIFQEKLRTSTITWVNQCEPKGFGNAVMTAQPFVQNESCIVHAGDSCIISKNEDHIKRLLDAYDRLCADAVFIVMETRNPREYGIIEGSEVETGVFKVSAAVEKPENPQTNMAIIAIYAFSPVIFEALKQMRPGRNGEIQLTDAIQKLVDWGSNVYAVKLGGDIVHLDIDNPQRYWAALSRSYRHSLK